jgi:hypothetical protein
MLKRPLRDEYRCKGLNLAPKSLKLSLLIPVCRWCLRPISHTSLPADNAEVSMMHFPLRAPWWRLLFLLYHLAGLVLGADAKPSSRQLLQSSGTAPAAGPQPAPNSKAAPPNVAPSPGNLPSGLTTNAGLPYPFMPGLFVFGEFQCRVSSPKSKTCLLSKT